MIDTNALPMDAAVILESLRDELARQSSPWVNRRAAAAYALCSERFIDEAADRGLLKRYWLGALPRFKKSDLDKLIEKSAAPALRRGRKQQ